MVVETYCSRACEQRSAHFQRAAGIAINEGEHDGIRLLLLQRTMGSILMMRWGMPGNCNESVLHNGRTRSKTDKNTVRAHWSHSLGALPSQASGSAPRFILGQTYQALTEKLKGAVPLCSRLHALPHSVFPQKGTFSGGGEVSGPFPDRPAQYCRETTNRRGGMMPMDNSFLYPCRVFYSQRSHHCFSIVPPEAAASHVSWAVGTFSPN